MQGPVLVVFMNSQKALEKGGEGGGREWEESRWREAVGRYRFTSRQALEIIERCLAFPLCEAGSHWRMRNYVI